jgi:divalent metal cation (Fe/Co/Zn/Cd) transporter
MAALSIFTLGAGFSVHEGVEKILHRGAAHAALGDPRWAYAVLLLSMVLEGYSLSVARKEFETLRQGRPIRQTLREARDPTVLTVLFEDLAALAGLAVALVGIAVSHATGDVLWDGMASIVVGLMLGFVAYVLAKDSMSLLIGKAMTARDEETIRAIVVANSDVCEIVHLRTMHLGPEEVIAAIKVRFSAALDTRTLEQRINEIEAELRRALPRLHRIYIEPGFDERAAKRAP